MTTLEFNAAQGRLVLDRRLLTALGTIASGSAEPDADAADELAALGLVDAGGEVTAAAAATAQAVATARATCSVRVSDVRGTRSATIWVAGGRAVLQTDSGGAPVTVVSVVDALLPLLLARATGFAPLPAPLNEEPADDRGFVANVDALLAAVAGSAPPPWPADGEQARLWLVETRLRNRVDPPTVTVLDVAGAGLWRPAAEAGTALRWEATNARVVWRALAEIHAAVTAATAGDDPAT